MSTKERHLTHARQIFRALSATTYGQSLRELERYTYFRNSEPSKLWRQALGASANTYEHSRLFYKVGEWFMRLEEKRFSAQEWEIFLMGMAAHDFGEASTEFDSVGDIPTIHKTVATNTREAAIAHYVIEKLDIPHELKEKLHQAYSLVVEGNHPALHHAFAGLEKTEYVRTAIKAANNFSRRGEPAIADHHRLVGAVLLRAVPIVVTDFAPHYPSSIGCFMSAQSSIIEEAFEAARPVVLSLEEYISYIPDYDSAWENFKLQNGLASGK